MEQYEQIERNLITKNRKLIWSRFVRAVSNYELINEDDKVMVCISGGKDSFLMAKCFQELVKHGNTRFSARYVVMNPGYTDKNLQLIKNNAKKLNIPIDIFDTQIFDIVNNNIKGNPCYLCARMRRGYLYNKAKELGCNKIALGHHFDDVIETTLLSMFYGAEIKTMLPKLHSDNFKGIDLIRPMYLIKEHDIISWKNTNKLVFLNCACKFTEENYSTKETNSKRKEIKNLIQKLKELNPNIDDNIFKALDNVNLNCILSSHKDNVTHNFLEDFNNTK